MLHLRSQSSAPGEGLLSSWVQSSPSSWWVLRRRVAEPQYEKKSRRPVRTKIARKMFREISKKGLPQCINRSQRFAEPLNIIHIYSIMFPLLPLHTCTTQILNRYPNPDMCPQLRFNLRASSANSTETKTTKSCFGYVSGFRKNTLVGGWGCYLRTGSAGLLGHDLGNSVPVYDYAKAHEKRHVCRQQAYVFLWMHVWYLQLFSAHIFGGFGLSGVCLGCSEIEV